MQAAPKASESIAAEPSDVAWQGIEQCRRGDWQQGLFQLSEAVRTAGEDDDLPGLLYAYLGYGIAKTQRQVDEGLKLCRRAVEQDLYQPESYYFLARTCLLGGDRREASIVVDRGLRVDSTHAGLAALRAELGQRRQPVLGFLPRRHPVNRWLGLIRHRLLGPGPRS